MHALSLLLVPQLVAAATVGSRADPDNRALYFLNNDPAGSSIVSLKISSDDGTLSNPVMTPTGGKGLYGLSSPGNGAPPVPGMADTLFSQDAVVVSQDYLFTVNAGSHTLSMFLIDKNDPYHPTLVGTPADTLGEFPSTVAYSPRLKTACVLNGGAIAGVTCFSTDHAKGLTHLGGLRSISLSQTTPPVGPPNTASDIVFNPSQTALIATIKGNGSGPGSIYAYAVLPDGSISTTPVVSHPSALLIDFSVSFLGSDSRALITDPAYGASIVDISPSLAVTEEVKIPVAGQGAICWSVYSARFNTVFLLDAGGQDITLVDPATGVITGTLAQDAIVGGSFDSMMDRECLYVLKGKNFITVNSVKGLNNGKTPKEVQALDLSGLGPRMGWQGLAVYPSSS